MSFGVGVCMRNPCPPFVSKEGSRDRIYALKERAASLLLGIGRALKVSCLWSFFSVALHFGCQSPRRRDQGNGSLRLGEEMASLGLDLGAFRSFGRGAYLPAGRPGPWPAFPLPPPASPATPLPSLRALRPACQTPSC